MNKANYFLLVLSLSCSVEAVSREKKEENRPAAIFPEPAPLLLMADPPKTPEEIKPLPNGLLIEELSPGLGAEAVPGRELQVHYTGKLPDGTVVDSSLTRGVPLSFRLGERRMIEGWELGLIGMKVGGRRRLTIPPALAYGSKGTSGKIPPNATLIFEVELLGVK